MATWNKIKFFWRSLPGSTGSTLAATSTASGYDVDYLHNMLEVNGWKAANGAVPMYIDLDMGSGLLTNGDFETGDSTGWGKADLNGAASTFAVLSDAPYEGSWYANVAITNGGPGAWDIQLYTDSSNKISVEAGKDYTVIFSARSAAARTIGVAVTKGVTPYTNYGLNQTVNLTTADQVFTYDFTATVTASDARLYFLLGGDTNGVGIDVVGIYLKSLCRADYLAVLGHNLNSISAALTLQYSSDGTYTADQNNVFLNDAPASDGVYLKEFTSPGPYRYWRLRISEAGGGGTLSPVPYMDICVWGLKTELDYASASFDPRAQNAQAAVNITQGGFVSGIFTRHIEREMSLSFQDVAVPDGWDADAANLYYKMTDWWENHGMKQFFVAWENANMPDDVFLMRPDGSFKNPLTHGGAYRDITINLKGRKA